MIEWALAGGIQRPKHRGHPGQPSPEPVARTSPPVVTARNVSTVVRSDSRASRDIPGRRIGGVPVPDKAGLARGGEPATGPGRGLQCERGCASLVPMGCIEPTMQLAPTEVL